MKNIHILPTDKPSRLFENTDGCLSIDDELQPNGVMCQNQNIYITSDEEIKANEWFYSPNTTSPQVYGHNDIPKDRGFKKIIITTDQDLIKDGVQAIDDEFLEWFVKNTSCEEVVIEDYGNLYNFRYLILIPKEEEVKEETLEEAALKWFVTTNKREIIFDLGWIKIFEAGAKWQQEITYSEEDLKEAFSMGRTGKTIEEFNIKFKNK